MANGVYVRGQKVVGDADIDSAVLTLMLVSTGYAFASTGQLVDDGSTNDPKSYEIGVSGYSRQNLASLSLYETTSDFTGLDATDATFTSLAAGETIGGAVLYRYSTSGGTTSDTGQDLVSFYDLTDTPTNGGNIVVAWASTTAGSVLKLGTTA